MQEQLAFTSQLLELDPTPPFVKDAQGRFERFNAAWLALMGWPLEPVIGVPIVVAASGS